MGAQHHDHRSRLRELIDEFVADPDLDQETSLKVTPTRDGLTKRRLLGSGAMPRLASMTCGIASDVMTSPSIHQARFAPERYRL
jgi:hypothetical protein